ncbi:MAG TPA: PspC domain-containing protein [Defluviitaleaceae bacterium]|jgi:phage shock protein C|nr:PspC domain-containing protein [Candidatus Epulonipiscium sp.]HOQ16936.1 PspC domain-containing protein [Defluviitaleaceae bacterium]HPT76830.1 PspC domain-containing protein [Defluviitaleaceae bacterium]HQD49774.1 PspC domain-containing protein [Defluviitaleaceae bacterium]
MKKKLCLSNRDKKFAGVCGGIAEFFDIDATLVRIFWALLTLMSSIIPGIILYLICWAIMPMPDDYKDMR